MQKDLLDKLTKECTKNVEEVKLAKITSTEDENKHKCSFCVLHIILVLILSTINIGIGTYFVYFHWYLKKDIIRVKFGTRTQTTS